MGWVAGAAGAAARQPRPARRAIARLGIETAFREDARALRARLHPFGRSRLELGYRHRGHRQAESHHRAGRAAQRSGRLRAGRSAAARTHTQTQAQAQRARRRRGRGGHAIRRWHRAGAARWSRRCGTRTRGSGA